MQQLNLVNIQKPRPTIVYDITQYYARISSLPEISDTALLHFSNELTVQVSMMP